MDRFTIKQPNETYHIYDLGTIKKINCYDEKTKNWFSLYKGTVINKLGQYEDTGLTPQEIEQMKARMPLHNWAEESPEKMSIFGVSVKKIMELIEEYKKERKIIMEKETNYEHYKDEIIKTLFTKDSCEFKKEYILKSGECANIICSQCEDKTKEWLDAPYEEPELEIDWTKVPVDTPVLVKDNLNDSLTRRYFAKYFPHSNVPFECFPNGANSWSSTGRPISWPYCELAREEDKIKYSKTK